MLCERRPCVNYTDRKNIGNYKQKTKQFILNWMQTGFAKFYDVFIYITLFR